MHVHGGKTFCLTGFGHEYRSGGRASQDIFTIFTGRIGVFPWILRKSLCCRGIRRSVEELSLALFQTLYNDFRKKRRKALYITAERYYLADQAAGGQVKLVAGYGEDGFVVVD